MKKFTYSLLFCAVIGSALLLGCSKAKDGGAASGSGTGTSTTAAAAVNAPLDMKIKWTVGKKYAQRMEMAQKMDMNMPNMPQPMKQEMNLTEDYSFSALKERDGGGTEVELEFVGFKIDSKMDERALMSFDTSQDVSQDGSNPMASTIRKMIGAHLKLLSDADGKVDKVEGYSEFMGRVAGGGKPQDRAMMQSFFNEDTLKQMCAWAKAMPGHPVKIGDTWPVKLDVSMGPMGTMIMDLKYTFKNWEQHDDRKCARLEYKGTMTSKPSGVPTPMAMKIEKGQLSGTTWYDPELAMVVDTVSDQDMTMKITMQGKPMNSKIAQKITVKLTEVTDLAK